MSDVPLDTDDQMGHRGPLLHLVYRAGSQRRSVRKLAHGHGQCAQSRQQSSTPLHCVSRPHSAMPARTLKKIHVYLSAIFLHAYRSPLLGPVFCSNAFLMLMPFCACSVVTATVCSQYQKPKLLYKRLKAITLITHYLLY